ncbi:APC family permease [Porticoccaceae bacterium]|nr:APC family permease [Porticoccaceae bacterium]MDB2533130.1 APC family permease [Porticoccaceae bacterium]MDC0517408.1 APC family permease [Porticoccaceae bacterium]MDC0590210.1 APC family permease [Porticoccaceae bacterium]
MSTPADKTRFLRVLGRRDILALAFGAMIGWSWVVLTGAWIGSAGTMGAITAFVIGGVAILLISLIYAELASALPFAGGEHVYSERALGSGASFVCTWGIILGYASVVTFEAVALPTVLDSLIPGLDKVYLWQIAGWDIYLSWVLVGVLGAAIMTVVNVLGVRMVALVQSVVVIAILLVGVLLVSGAVVTGDISNMQPLFKEGVAGITLVLVMVPFMFVGFDTIPQVAEEVDLPFRDIGVVLIASVAMAIVWYGLIILAVGLVLDQTAIDASTTVTAEANARIYGEVGGTVLLVAGLAGIITSWNAFILGGSRAIYALANSGLLPKFLGQLHPKYHTPTNAIVLLGVLSALGPFFGRPALVWVVNAGSLGIVIAYVMVTWSFLVLRNREPSLDRPYKVPFGQFVGSLALVLAIGMTLLYLPGSPAALLWPQEWGIIIAWIILGGFLYGIARKSLGR